MKYVFAAVAILAATNVFAGAYACKGPNGETIFADRPDSPECSPIATGGSGKPENLGNLKGDPSENPACPHDAQKVEQDIKRFIATRYRGMSPAAAMYTLNQWMEAYRKVCEAAPIPTTREAALTAYWKHYPDYLSIEYAIRKSLQGKLKWTPCLGQFCPEFKLVRLLQSQRFGAAPS